MFRLTTLVSALLFVQIPSTTHQVRIGKQFQYPRKLYEPCVGQEAGKFIKDRYACDKFFYCGSGHVAVSVDCPHGMIFNDEKEICDFPWNYNCVPEKREDEQTEVTVSDVETSTIITTRPSSFSSTKQTTKPTKPPKTTHPTNSHTLPANHNRCPSNDSNKLVFLPNKNDCHRYYICYHGHPMQLECIQELHWNPKLERCDFPENAGCLSTATTTVMPPLRTTASVVKAVMNCPVRGEHVLPHPGECNYFIYCVNGFATVQQCPFFHHYDVQSKSCMWQTVAKCIVNKNSLKVEKNP